MTLCLSVRLCLLHVGVRSKGMDVLIRFSACRLFSPVPYCVIRNFGGKGISLWNFVLNSGLRKFCHDTSTVERCYQLSSAKADAQSVINWTVVGQLSWQYLRAPTFIHCSLSQWSSSSVYSTILSRGTISDSWYLLRGGVKLTLNRPMYRNTFDPL